MNLVCGQGKEREKNRVLYSTLYARDTPSAFGAYSNDRARSVDRGLCGLVNSNIVMTERE